ncbi:MAG: bifunctional riboflavin kinase/FAD synthetase [Bacilli bacterium]
MINVIYFDVDNPIFIKDELSLCLGYFDGVHLGHLKLLEETINSPYKKAMVTFSISPYDFLHHLCDSVITTIEDKKEILNRLGFDYLIVLKTSKELLSLSKKDFIEQILKKFNPKKIVCGFDYSFGFKAEGNVEYLKEELSDVEIIAIDEYTVNGKKASSTLIKEYIEDGNIDKANNILGRPYTLKGTVIKGNQIGRTLSFPTVNVKIQNDYVIPCFGVYATKIKVDGEFYIGVTNVGIHPSIDKLAKPIIETHIIDFDRDIYFEKVEVEFYSFIRKERKFTSLDELKKQISIDKEKIIAYFQ